MSTFHQSNFRGCSFDYFSVIKSRDMNICYHLILICITITICGYNFRWSCAMSDIKQYNKWRTVNLVTYSNVTILFLYYKAHHVLQSVTESYYKVLQVLQSASGITKYDRLLLQSTSGITKCDRLLLQSGTVITKWDVTRVKNILKLGSSKQNNNDSYFL